MEERKSKQRDYFMSTLAFTIDFGNLWRFPYLVHRHGGGSFIIAYTVINFVIGVPLLILELELGQFTSCDINSCWEFCPAFKGLGLAINLHLIMSSISLSVVLAWASFLFNTSITSDLPWKLCEKVPAQNCLKSNEGDDCLYELGVNQTEKNCINRERFLRRLGTNQPFHPTDLFNETFLDMSKGDVGSYYYFMVLNITLVWIVVLYYASHGIGNVGKIVYLTLFFSVSIMIALLLELQLQGPNYEFMKFFKTDFSLLLKSKVWLEALTYTLCSLPLGKGVHTMLASFNDFDYNLIREAMVLASWDLIMNILSSLVVFSCMGLLATEFGEPVEKITNVLGPDLILSVLPVSLTLTTKPKVWNALYFIMVFSLGIDIQVLLLATMFSCILAFKPTLENKKTEVILILCVTLYIFSLPLMTRVGEPVFNAFLFSFGFCSLTIVAVENIAVAWFYGISNFHFDVTFMLGETSSWRILLTPFFIPLGFLCPLACAIAAWYMYSTESYYLRPTSVLPLLLTWVLNCISLIPLFVSMLVGIYQMPGSYVTSKVAEAFTYSEKWGPASSPLYSKWANRTSLLTKYNDGRTKTKTEIDMENSLLEPAASGQSFMRLSPSYTSEDISESEITPGTSTKD